VRSRRDRRILLGELLRGVSRSFYLTLRVLPAPIRDQIGTAYLLARATDTIADTDALPPEERLEALHQLRDRIIGQLDRPLSFAAFASAANTSPHERLLLARIEEVLALLASFEEKDCEFIRDVLTTITSGQELDLKRFAHATDSKIVALATPAELDDYTYRVAGCVGEFWTRICLHHLSGRPALSAEELIARGIRFGKGLQLVNILRDLPRDLRNGRCYLPAEELRSIALAPSDLLDFTNEKKLRPVYDRWLHLAHEHLQSGWSYVLALPRGWVRVRLACAWPILIGMQTLAQLRRGNVLDPAQRIKISRREVKRIMRLTLVALPFRSRWERLPERVTSSSRDAGL
jgi:farnesyl-diphosphate farnesyltransferase